MKNKIFSKFLVPTLMVGLFGFVSLVYGQSDTSTTSTSIDNSGPAFTADAVESWVQAYTGSASTNSRSESSTTYPTNEGTNVTFTATAHDDNSDDYYLIVCDAAGVTAGSEAAPTCTGSQICVSSATTTDTAATCNVDTTSEANETVAWYAYVCDHNSSASCSAASDTSQGGTNDEANGSNGAGSPYHVNHAPTFTAGTVVDSGDGTIEPTDTVKFINSANDDGDTNGIQDTINLFVCSGESDMGGVTTAFDYYTALSSPSTACTGGTMLCAAMDVDPTVLQVTCNDTTSIAAAPIAEATDYTVQFYVSDAHGMPASGTGGVSQDFAVTDVHPTLVANTIDSSMPTIAAEGSGTVTLNVAFEDLNGDNDPTYLDMVFYDSNVTTDACSADENNCYRFDDENLASPVNCTVNNRSTGGTGKHASGTDTQLDVDCDYTVYFNANASTVWMMGGTATDDASASTDVQNFSDSGNMSLGAITGMGVTEASINYGSLSPGDDSIYQSTNMYNAGNQVIDVLLGGTYMAVSGYSGSNCAADTDCIDLPQQEWHHTDADFTWSSTYDNAGPNPLIDITTPPGAGASIDGCLNRDMAVRDVHDTGTEDESIAWKLRIPASQGSGSYTGTNTFTATVSSTCSGAVY